MERLTEKCWRNLDPWETCGQDKFCTRECHEKGGCANGCKVPKLYRKLAEYEDAEEQGLLLRLPCRFGDTVWWIAPNCVGEPSIVLDTKFDDSMIRRLDWFGKVFFTTKEEAEQALADMKKG